MRISQRLDYALRAVVLLAGREVGAYVSGTEIAASLVLPQRVVEQQLSALARAGILRSRPGAGGGHTLARPAEQISVADVVHAIQVIVIDVPRVAGSAASEVWSAADEALEAHLSSARIDVLARRQAELDRSAAEHYSI